MFLAIALLAVGAGLALAHPTHAAPRKVMVVMHDPAAELLNVDEAAIKVVRRPGFTKRGAIGKTLLLGKGDVHDHDGRTGTRQHLKLTVR